MNTGDIDIQGTEPELINAILNSADSSNPAYTILKIDERVIARVTDGIYRQPSSALRELISNAYDADSTKVVIKTDAPRFQRISIEDDGHGMTPQALARMLMHIGGSAKRQISGKDYNITSQTDPDSSPNGRKLIGKIGIGIFSVAQLTHNFQIITKVKGTDFRTIAVINLKQYTDERTSRHGEDNKYESGKVTVWREKAADLNSHGTTIVLNNIRPQARETLQSKVIWDAIRGSEENIDEDSSNIVPPKYHIGTVDINEEELLKETNGNTNSLPYSIKDSPRESFGKLVDSVWNELNAGNISPKLDELFDYYLQMVWNLGLSIPVPYVFDHLFDMKNDEWAENYVISNHPKGGAEPVKPSSSKSIRDVLGLEEGLSSQNFEVYIDDLQILRPIKYKDLPTGGHALKKPLILFGNCEENFSKYPTDLSGGKLRFEAYLFWNPKIAPTEHRGALIRVNGASGTLFDSTFLRYQVKENIRLSQTTCEIFILEGFDSALNIDRESFNFAHPHAVYLTRWLHSALRQLATTQKKLASEVRTEVRSDAMNQQRGVIEKIAVDTWKKETGDKFSVPPSIEIVQDLAIPKTSTADIVIKTPALTDRNPQTMSSQINSEKVKAIAQILASFGVFEHLDTDQQSRLLNAIYKVIDSAN